MIHGHGSVRGNHADFCARLATAGISALALDLRGHGESGGRLDAGLPGDVVAAIDHLCALGAGPIGLRGSSLGGYLALLAATHPSVRAVAAICPADNVLLAARYPEYSWARDLPLTDRVGEPTGVARGYWHARGDEIVAWPGTWVLHASSADPRHLRVVMGGHHRSLQHDPDIQEQTIRWLAEHLTLGGRPDGPQS